MKTSVPDAAHRPSWSWPLRASRLAAELGALVRPSPFPMFDPEARRALRPGDGHAVLVIPASLRSDRQTPMLRAFLAGLGYTAYGWDLGVNLGPTERVVRGLGQRLDDLYAAHCAVSVVGFSLGGLFARLLAARHPARVRQVITVCSPVQHPAGSVWIGLDSLLGWWPWADLRALSAEIEARPPVPSTCIYSRDDGIVRWTHCRDPAGDPEDNIEVGGCHVTMPHNAQVLRILAARLARQASDPPGGSAASAAGPPLG